MEDVYVWLINYIISYFSIEIKVGTSLEGVEKLRSTGRGLMESWNPKRIKLPCQLLPFPSLLICFPSLPRRNAKKSFQFRIVIEKGCARI